MGASFDTMKVMASFLLLMFFAAIPEFVLSEVSNGDFLSFPKTTSRSSELCCNDDHLLTCTEVEFDPENLSNENIQLMGIDFCTRIVLEMRPSLTIMKTQEIFLEASTHMKED